MVFNIQRLLTKYTSHIKYFGIILLVIALFIYSNSTEGFTSGDKDIIYDAIVKTVEQNKNYNHFREMLEEKNVDTSKITIKFFLAIVLKYKRDKFSRSDFDRVLENRDRKEGADMKLSNTQISQCDESFKAIVDVLDKNEITRRQYNRDLQLWEEDIRNPAMEKLDAEFERGKYIDLTTQDIELNGQKHDCSKFGTGLFCKDAGGTQGHIIRKCECQHKFGGSSYGNNKVVPRNIKSMCKCGLIYSEGCKEGWCSSTGNLTNNKLSQQYWKMSQGEYNEKVRQIENSKPADPIYLPVPTFNCVVCTNIIDFENIGSANIEGDIKLLNDCLVENGSQADIEVPDTSGEGGSNNNNEINTENTSSTTKESSNSNLLPLFIGGGVSLVCLFMCILVIILLAKS